MGGILRHGRAVALPVALVLATLALPAVVVAQGTPPGGDGESGHPASPRPGTSKSGAGPLDGAVIDKTKPGTASDRGADPCETLPNDRKVECRNRVMKPEAHPPERVPPDPGPLRPSPRANPRG